MQQAGLFPQGKRKPPVPRERDIQRGILEYLRHHRNCLVTRLNAGKFTRRHKSGKETWIHGADAGWPDIIGQWQGKALAIETKRPGKNLEPHQEAFRQAWERLGGVWITARSLEDVRGVLG